MFAVLLFVIRTVLCGSPLRVVDFVEALHVDEDRAIDRRAGGGQHAHDA